jgi:UDP-GlcNAc:undecaprenyl-phosphate GlcNAc-1-phosphate transferase
VAASYAALFVAAASLCVIITPVVRAAAVQLGAIDRGGSRHVHRGGVPRLGGVALLIAGAGALLLAQAVGIGVLDLLTAYGWRLEWLAAGALVIVVLGSVDDLRGVGPLAKLAWQTLAAVIAVWGGFGFAALTNPFGDGVVWLGALGGLLSVIWILVVTNAFNLIDGLDGLAAGTGLIAAVTLFLVALAEGRPDAAAMAALLAGLLTGFLRFNFAPASIFLGDAGSLLLGYVLAVLSIQSLQKGPTAVVILVPILTLGLPILEAAVTIARRWLVAGIASIFRADREHIHHRLLALGMTDRRAVLLLYGVCAAFGALALLAIGSRALGNAAIVAGAALLAAIALRRLGYRGR